MGLPPIVDGHFTFLDTREQPDEERIREVTDSQGLRDWAPEQELLADLEVATANVLSAGPDHNHTGVGTGRLASLARQFESAGIQVAGIQESRMRTEAPMKTHGFSYVP